MKSIFEDAYLGKAYRTRDGRRVVIESLYSDCAYLISKYELSNGFSHSNHKYRLDGINTESADLDIVSEWREEVNEEELDNLACEYSQGDALCRGVSEGYTCPGLIKAFKAGYKKAKEGQI